MDGREPSGISKVRGPSNGARTGRIPLDNFRMERRGDTRLGPELFVELLVEL